MDSRRIISADRDGSIHVWLVESGTMLQTLQAPHKHLLATNNMKFAVNDKKKTIALYVNKIQLVCRQRQPQMNYKL